MGEVIGSPVDSQMRYVSVAEFDRLLNSNIPDNVKVEFFAALCRVNILYMIAKAGSGHIGSSYSSIDIMSYIFFSIKYRGAKYRFFSSKGHDAPALYSVLIAFRELEEKLLHQLRRINGLPGHPDINTPSIIANTGSLGMGISKAKGMIHANRLSGVNEKIIVLTGDGELQEGQIWESLFSAVNKNLYELIVIVDHNKLQSDTTVSSVSDLGDLEGKFRSFGLNVYRCNGNSISEIENILSSIDGCSNSPTVIIADTVKGQGVSFMEHTSIDSDVEYYKFHSGAPSQENYNRAILELEDKLNLLCKKHNMPFFSLDYSDRPKNIQAHADFSRLIPEYSKILVQIGEKNQKIVVLDADLMMDTGIYEFYKRFPRRFIECGIAEQDMASQASGLALNGYLPIVHSFSCFLTSRPNEQIYNNSTELKKIIYVGSLAGLLPAGPGHSHQAVRDIASLQGIPNLTMVSPSNIYELRRILDLAINEIQETVYIRLESSPFIQEYDVDDTTTIKIGQGVEILQGKDGVVFTYGPLLTNIAYKAIKKIKNKEINIKLISLPWLNRVDSSWFREVTSGMPFVVSLENHYAGCGQSIEIMRLLLEQKNSSVFKNFGISEIPKSGQNDEVLEYHGLDENAVSVYLERLFEDLHP